MRDRDRFRDPVQVAQARRHPIPTQPCAHPASEFEPKGQHGYLPLSCSRPSPHVRHQKPCTARLEQRPSCNSASQTTCLNFFHDRHSTSTLGSFVPDEARHGEKNPAERCRSWVPVDLQDHMTILREAVIESFVSTHPLLSTLHKSNDLLRLELRSDTSQQIW